MLREGFEHESGRKKRRRNQTALLDAWTRVLAGVSTAASRSSSR
jgi:hypothetical protein